MDGGGDLWRYCLTSALYPVFEAVDLKTRKEKYRTAGSSAVSSY
jgi:hypothetical protein